MKTLGFFFFFWSKTVKKLFMERVFDFLISTFLFISICTDGDAVLLKCGGFAFLDPSYAFDRRIIQSMELMFSGNNIKQFNTFCTLINARSII